MTADGMLWLAVAYSSAEACDSMLGNAEVQNASKGVDQKITVWWEWGEKSTQRRHLESFILYFSQV